MKDIKVARKEINIFGTSFLDLLSGALAAVIILFIIVPKMTSEQQETLEEIERMNVQVEELNDLIGRLQDSVPHDVYEEIQRQMEELDNVITELTDQVRRMQERLATAESENYRLQEELEQRQEIQQQNELLQQRIRQLETRLQQQQQDGREGIAGGKVFGMDAELGVVCMWPENVDVDLYVKDILSGEICFFNAKNRSFGSLMEDVTSRNSPEDDRYELFYQKKIVPGTYQIYVNIYNGQNSRWNGTPAHVEGYVVMFPGRQNQIKIPYRQIVLTQAGQNAVIGILSVTNNSINLQQE